MDSPNIQNIPVRTEDGNKIKEAFTGTPTESAVDPRAALLVLLDSSVQGAITNPLEQLGVLMAACALAGRRVIESKDTGDANVNRAVRLRLIKTAVGEFEAKLRKYLRPVNP